MKRIVHVLLLALATTAMAWGQGIPTGTIAGRVVSDGQPVGGVTIEATSEALQGRRSVVTSAGGDYTLPLLPPGEYHLTFALAGLQTVTREVKVSAAQSHSVEVDMAVEGVAETVNVTATADTISANSEVATTLTKTLVEKLPTARNIREAIQLAPGVNDNGPSQSITIAGGQSYENLFLIDGVVVNENLRGQGLNLFVEDAIEETTASVAGVSAEYGRFAGGVVNTITKSGGNDFHGSLRDWVTSDRWTAPTALTVSRADDVNSRYEGTLGGRIVRDHLWFFATARAFDTSVAGQTSLTDLPFAADTKETRAQAKLTFSPDASNRIIGTYTKIDREETNNVFGTVLDLASLDGRKLPQELLAVNYSGIFSNTFFGTAQFSKRKFTFVGSGSDFTDRIRGTVIRDNITDYRYNSPTFCGVCGDENRDNQNLLAKASWFLSTASGGSHEIALGVDTFKDVRKANNHQSGSDFQIFSSDTIVRDGQAYPVFIGDGSSDIAWWPILVNSRGTDLRTNSAYLNDQWRLGARWSFNLGVRYDKNDGKDSNGAVVAKDAKFSPRLGVTWDPRGDGDWLLSASAGEYVTAIANTVADATSPAGNPAIYDWLYFGPDVNADPNGPLVGPQEAIRRFFEWFDSVGGVNNTSLDPFIRIPGGTSFINGTLKSPSTREYALGFSKRLGTRGAMRADLIHRESRDFYSGRVDASTGIAITQDGRTVDRELIENENDLLERRYDGLLTQFQYRRGDLFFGGAYTLSKVYGNVNGETSGNGPVRSSAASYPEYKEGRWSYPKGDLATDQRHRLRLWATYDFFHNDRHGLTAGVLQSYASGTPYGAVGAVDTRRLVTGTNYHPAPTNVPYFFTARDAFHTPAVYATDISLSYSFFTSVGQSRVELFLQPQVLNVFNRQAPLLVNTGVFDATSRASLRRFNPFTETPVEGVHWTKGPDFGRAVNPTDVQTPRTFRVSLGVRF